jgi:amidase
MDNWGALRTAQAVRTGEVSAVEACQAAIARIEARDGPVHAVVIRDFDRALEQARAIDRRVAAGEAMPLAGVPMTVKESFAVGGLPGCWGIAPLAGWTPPDDRSTVRNLKRAGAVILGKTNVPVALADWQSDNPVYGRTSNPHDLTRSPGGSSGGSAAALAAGMVPLEMGSDIGGSIRVPAHFCGVFGHKPTYGIVPLDGHPFPGADGAPPVLSVAGPMARAADDLAVALDITSEVMLARPRHTSLNGVRILLLTAHPVAAVSSRIVAQLETVMAAAQAEGATVLRTHRDLPDLEAVHRAYMPLLLAQLAIRNPAPDQPPPQLPAWMEMLDAQARTIRAFGRLFEDVDLIVCPVTGMEAFAHTTLEMRDRTVQIDGADLPFADQFAWISMATYACLPATSAPLGRMDSGLPVNMQVIGRRFDDQTVIALAGLLSGLALEGAACGAHL